MCIRDRHHVPRDDEYRRTLQPVYKDLPGWSEDISMVRQFADLPVNAQSYVAWMLQSLVSVANYGDKNKIQLPNLRYIGVGPEPCQIIKDIPETSTLLAMAN